MHDELCKPSFVQVGRSDAQESYAAVREAVAEINTAESCFVLAFVPNLLDVNVVVQVLDRELGGLPVFGCTTAGQITPNGYEADALLLMAFPRAHFRCASLLLDNLQPISPISVAADVQRLVDKFQPTARWNRLGLIFADGVSKQEDLLISTLEATLRDLPVFGGSAGDGLRFEETFVLHEGMAVPNAAVLLLIETDLEFQGLGFDHFRPDGAQVVITDANAEERIVYEINGAPAAEEYARLVGCNVEALSPEVFAENPMLLRHNSSHYVRAIQHARDDNALSFLAAIDDGLIMTLGRGQAVLETLDTGLAARDSKGQVPDFILGFDCVLRKLEIEQKSLLEEASGILQSHNVYGFNTYGEQQSGLHMNQTFVGVAFFDPRPETAL